MNDRMQRRDFLKLATATTVAAPLLSGPTEAAAAKRPNILFVFADQWRAQATGYAGDPNARTPVLDGLAAEGLNFCNAVSGCPVCSPYRASLLTGQYPLTHGVFLNDVHLPQSAVSIADVCKAAGYDTAYIGKWHVDGRGRTSYIPPEGRQGFDYWKVLECTHNYNNSPYYAGDDKTLRRWDGYDAIAQTKDACSYIAGRGDDKPFLLMLSWGPPHAPYLTAPEKHRKQYRPEDVQLHPNVPRNEEAKAREELAGYYAHIAALDDCMAMLLETLDDAGIADDTILVFTSDHGDMLRSHGMTKKQKPHEESVRVPFLLRYPGAHGRGGRTIDMPINTPDIMPTLLGLAGMAIPDTVEGADYSAVIRGETEPANDAVLLSCPSPFGQWDRRRGGREYRGIRTRRHTYVRDLNGPWLLFDNRSDPYQLNNLVDDPNAADLQKRLEARLSTLLKERGDEFLPGPEYIKRWNWTVDEHGTVPYWLKK